MPPGNGERLPAVKDGGTPRGTAGGSVGQRASERVRQRSAGLAAIVRAERDERNHKHLSKGEGASSSRGATAAEKEQVSVMLNQRMISIFLDPQARSWYKLFVHMDDDCSGKVNFHELEDMIRNELKVSKAKLSDEQLRAVWRALDEDESGLITVGEFGSFMRLGDHIHASDEPVKAKLIKKKEVEAEAVRQQHKELISMWKDSRELDTNTVTERTAQLRKAEAGRGAAAVARLKQQNAATAQALRQELIETSGMKKAGDSSFSAPPATAEVVLQVSTILNHRMVDIFLDPQARSWYKLFVHMDDDCSGKITFHEFEDMIRNELKVSTSKLSAEQLRSVWHALDDDGSGLVTVGEFGKFMRLGDHVHEVSDPGRAKVTRARTAEGGMRRQEKNELRELRNQAREADEATKRSRAAETYGVARGLRAPADSHAAWKSPNALIY